MRIHTLQHVHFEGLGSLENTLTALGHSLSFSHLYRGDALPAPDQFDALIIMGGPMGVHDDDRYPWLAAEKSLLRQVAADTGKPMLGICLGAQLIAAVLGAPVTRNPQVEIGWHSLRLDPAFASSPWGDCLTDDGEVFHWHGDTFALPSGALPVAASIACANQGFILDNRVIGLQFHLETTEESARALIRECVDELQSASAGSAHVQSPGEMLSNAARFVAINAQADALVRRWLEPFSHPGD